MSKTTKPTRKRGRPITYTAAVAETICKRLASGESLRAICRDETLPSESTVRGWAVDDREGFAAQYARARDIRLDAMADELREIADDGSNDWMERVEGGKPVSWQLNGEHVQRSRLRVDTRKWLLAKMAPKRYGDRLNIDATDPNDEPEKPKDEGGIWAARLRGITSGEPA